MKYNKIILPLVLIILISLFNFNNENFDNPQVFLVKLNYKENTYFYNLYDNTYKYKSYCDFVKNLSIIFNNEIKKTINYENYIKEIKKYIYLNDLLIHKNNNSVKCEREFDYKVKYIIPTIDNIYDTDGFYDFLYVLFLKHKLNLTTYEINKDLKRNMINIEFENTNGNIFIKMREHIFMKEICDPQMIAEISKNNIVKNDLDKRIERRNPFKNVPKVIELKPNNNKFELIIDNDYYKNKCDTQKLNKYINTFDFKRRLIINTNNDLDNFYITNKLNNIYYFNDFEKIYFESKNKFKSQFNNNLNCEDIICNNDLQFNSSDSFDENMFKCKNGKILIHFKNEPYETNNTIDINKLHYVLCPSNINGKLVGMMDYFNKNCSIGDIEPEYIFSKKTSYTKLPFNYWLFS